MSLSRLSTLETEKISPLDVLESKWEFQSEEEGSLSGSSPAPMGEALAPPVQSTSTLRKWTISGIEFAKRYVIGQGNRLNSSGLHKYIKQSLFSDRPASDEYKSEAINTDRLEGDLDVIFYPVNNDKMVVILPPACDLEEVGLDSVGTRPVAELVKLINPRVFENPNQYTIFIPLGECRNGRTHWTLIVLHKGEWHFFDPKDENPLMLAALKAPYDLEPCTELVRSGLPAALHDSFTLEKRWLGIQSVINDTHCGYYVEHIIGQLIKKCIESRDPVSLRDVSIDAVDANALYNKYVRFNMDDEVLYEAVREESHALLLGWNSKIPDYKDTLISKIEDYGPKNPKKPVFEALLQVFSEKPDDVLLDPETTCLQWHAKWQAGLEGEKTLDFNAMIEILKREETYLGAAASYLFQHQSMGFSIISGIFGEFLIGYLCSGKDLALKI